MEKSLLNTLTPRELETLCLLADGMEYTEIATHMLISINGVRANIKNIYRKLEVKNNVQAAKFYWKFKYQRSRATSTAKKVIA